MKKLRVTIEGKVYEVLVETIDDPSKPAPAPVFSSAAAPAPAPVSAAATAPAPAARPAAAGGAGDVPSPLAGKIVSVDVKVGDSVQEGAQVATIEAMKMNTYIFAPKTGKVAEILVTPGEGVEEGTVLLRIA
ncbi:biotin/lipoyl-containing protein [Opitutus terrae]|uniref:Biotin/lipoyl attachment domain-containing protein n=1 Tax=Opitutus terrae (strain DSM 11246 / JCM 15787 / PB90-1) TaxID=452637 RepID=B1ZTD4_OPITP|nr:biotin/lipoyl-containing protein [Opitutus terrae]ACB76588.1 biotin/lipoyl attachment domain-containing protein [Opitutus terrae PB90-1]